MASDILVLDNFLEPNEFNKVSRYFNDYCQWQYSPFVTNDPHQGKVPADDEFQFVHVFWYPTKGIASDKFEHVSPVVNKLNPGILVRVKGNLNTKTPEVVQRDWHIDYDYGNKTAIYYINTCDGYTAFESGEKVPSVANRIVVFDGGKRHAGTTCTDQKTRMVLNINYFPHNAK